MNNRWRKIVKLDNSGFSVLIPVVRVITFMIY